MTVSTVMIESFTDPQEKTLWRGPEQATRGSFRRDSGLGATLQANLRLIDCIPLENLSLILRLHHSVEGCKM